MPVATSLSRRFLFLIQLFVFVLATSLTVAAQKYKLNQRIELNVDNKGVWYKGYIKDIQGFASTNGYYMVHLDQGVQAYGGGNEFMVTDQYFSLMRPEGATANPNPGNCSFGPPPGTFTGSSPASVPLFKWIVYNRLNLSATGTAGYPSRIGLTFLSFDAAKAYKNTVSIVAGRGAQRINDAAPANATIYPATMKYVVCEDYNTGIIRKMVETRFEFFVDRFGQWSASQPAFADKTTKIAD